MIRKRIIGEYLIPGRFDTFYQLFTDWGAPQPHPLAEEPFNGFFYRNREKDLIYELHRLHIDDWDWPKTAIKPLYDTPVSWCGTLCQHTLALQFIEGGWRIFRLPKVERQQVAHHSQQRVFAFYASQVPLPHLDSPLTFGSAQQASDFVSDLKMPTRFWEQCLRDQGLSYTDNPQKSASDHLASGQLCAFGVPASHRHTTFSTPNSLPPAPSDPVAVRASSQPLLPFVAPSKPMVTHELRYQFKDRLDQPVTRLPFNTLSSGAATDDYSWHHPQGETDPQGFTPIASTTTGESMDCYIAWAKVVQ